VKRNQKVFEHGDDGDYFYILLEGNCDFIKPMPVDKKRKNAEKKASQFGFGDNEGNANRVTKASVVRGRPAMPKVYDNDGRTVSPHEAEADRINSNESRRSHSAARSPLGSS
jgi:hypothetical protein